MQEIVELRKLGCTYKQIINKTGISRYRLIKILKENNMLNCYGTKQTREKAINYEAVENAIEHLMKGMKA